MSESQRLKHGKALCGKAFSRFVETFNELVDFKDNLKGDADLPTTHNGIVKVDRSDPAHPVVRTDLKELYREIDERVNKPKPDRTCFHIASLVVKGPDDPGYPKVLISLGNRYIMVGGVLREVSEPDHEKDADGNDAGGFEITGYRYLAMVLSSVDASGNRSEYIRCYENISDMNSAMRDETKYVVPLYSFTDDYDVLVDYRTAPNVQMFESPYPPGEEPEEEDLSEDTEGGEQ